MTERRGSRFLVEVLFLLALATALTLAHLNAVEIAGGMLLGWVVVAAFEWAAWRGEAHYGSGLPPRYYVPSVNLPPAQPLEQVAVGYPDASRDEAPTWIASAALRAEVLGEWPLATPVAVVAAHEDEEPEPVAEFLDGGGDADPWTVAELPVAPLEPEPEPEPAAEAEPEPLVEAEPEPEPEPTIDVVLARSAQGVARHTLDPLGDPAPKRRFSRGSAAEVPAVEVPARPEGVRPLPGRSTRHD